MGKKTKAEQQQRVVEYKDFQLNKFKLVSNGKVKSTLDYVIYNTDIESANEDCTTEPHEDLINSVRSLAEYMADNTGHLKIVDKLISDCKNDKQLDELKVFMDQRNEIIKMFKPSGISISGEGAKQALKITGSCNIPKRGSFSFATPRIFLGIDKIGYEDELSEIVEKIKEEVYLMRFNGKKGETEEDRQTKIT